MTESHAAVPPIAGAERVVERFGRWPSFHDAEVVRLVLDRAGRGGPGPALTLAVYAFETDGTLAPDGRYTLRNESLVTFEFDGVAELTIADFNHRNAIWALGIEDVSADQLEQFASGSRFPPRSAWPRRSAAGRRASSPSSRGAGDGISSPARASSSEAPRTPGTRTGSVLPIF